MNTPSQTSRVYFDYSDNPPIIPAPRVEVKYHAVITGYTLDSISWKLSIEGGPYQHGIAPNKRAMDEAIGSLITDFVMAGGYPRITPPNTPNLSLIHI